MLLFVRFQSLLAEFLLRRRLVAELAGIVCLAVMVGRHLLGSCDALLVAHEAILSSLNCMRKFS